MLFVTLFVVVVVVVASLAAYSRYFSRLLLLLLLRLRLPFLWGPLLLPPLLLLLLSVVVYGGKDVDRRASRPVVVCQSTWLSLVLSSVLFQYYTEWISIRSGIVHSRCFLLLLLLFSWIDYCTVPGAGAVPDGDLGSWLSRRVGVVVRNKFTGVVSVHLILLLFLSWSDRWTVFPLTTTNRSYTTSRDI